uniref:Uncharacterized protein n=1 Tax=Anguilla anguilla TaxID=7936 RepID=A0A0E9PE88_ANGAN
MCRQPVFAKCYHDKCILRHHHRHHHHHHNHHHHSDHTHSQSLQRQGLAAVLSGCNPWLVHQG